MTAERTFQRRNIILPFRPVLSSSLWAARSSSLCQWREFSHPLSPSDPSPTARTSPFANKKNPQMIQAFKGNIENNHKLPPPFPASYVGFKLCLTIHIFFKINIWSITFNLTTSHLFNVRSTGSLTFDLEYPLVPVGRDSWILLPTKTRMLFDSPGIEYNDHT